MKRILYAFITFAAVLAVFGCNRELGGELSVSPASLEFGGDAETQTLTVNASSSWTTAMSSNVKWCTLSKTYGKSSETIEVSVTANSNTERSVTLYFNTVGGKPVSVTVTQAPGTAESGPAYDNSVQGEFYPEASSGITVDPVYPAADEPCTIIFKPESGNPLYGYSGELYGHFGVVVEGEWMFVPTEWATTEEKTHFKKVAENHWEFRMEPSIREYFGSGETPVTKIALIVRTADGNTKSHDADQFCSVYDDKFEAEEFIPDEVVGKWLPEGVKQGINYNEDGSVTFVLYDKDKAGASHTYCYIVGDWNNWERVTRA